MNEPVNTQILSSAEAHKFLLDNNFVCFKGLTSGNPLVIEPLNEIRFIRFQLIGRVSLNLDKILIEGESGEDLRVNASILVSSSYEDLERFNGYRLLVGKPNGDVSYHSKNEDNPWVIVDLGVRVKPKRISVFNRNDHYFVRALSIKVSSSNDLLKWDKLHDNYEYECSREYNKLNAEKQAIIDCAARRIQPILSIIDTLKNNGEHAAAVKLLNAGNEVLSEYACALGPHGLTQTFAVRTDDQIELAYSELSRFLAVLNEDFGVDAFASSGTLLGFVRDGGFLAHDDDLDACYISRYTNPHDILKERKELCTFLEGRGYKVQESDVAHLWVRKGNNLSFDLFTGWIDGERCYMNPLPKPGVDVSDVRPTKIIESHGCKIYLPANPEALMVLNYGQGWQIPDPLWKFDWGHVRKQFNFLFFK